MPDPTCWICGAPSVPATELAPLSFVRCTDCGFVFAAARAEEDLTGVYTDDAYLEEYSGREDYAGAEGQRAFDARQRLTFLERFTGARRGALLEVGAATGAFLSVAAAAGFAARGIEPSPGAVAQARAAGLDVTEGLVEDVELPAAGLEVICAWHVLEHVPRPRPVLDQLVAALAPGGVVAFEVPNAGSVIARRDGAGWHARYPEHHVGQYSPSALRRLLEEAGLEVLAVETVSFGHYLRPTARLHPQAVAMAAKLVAAERAWPYAPHPGAHELLRAVGRRR